MCGISCIVTLKGQRPDSTSVQAPDVLQACDLERARLSKQLEGSLDAIKHRGPDGRNFWFSDHNRVALGHVRLSIVDLSDDAQQPFHDSENRIHAVVNGEFYDYQQHRATLEKKGHSFVSSCDSELIIALYKEYGLSMMDYLRGEFAFCLYDSKTQYFVAARDRYGVKPLFYTVLEGRLLVASEIKAFLAYGWKPKWDVQSIMNIGYLSDKRTLFEGVTKIKPGHYLTVQSFGTLTEQQYWDIEYANKHNVEVRTEEEMVLGVRKRLLNAVKVRLRADVPVGVYLSGGLDSSAVAGMMTHLMTKEGVNLGNEAAATANLNCFSIKFEDEAYDEEPIAQRTADWLGVKKHVMRCTEEVFVDNYSDAAWYSEQPLLDLNFISKVALSKFTRERGVKVVLTGEGSDEQFAGYANLLIDFLKETDHSWPIRELSESHRLQKLAEEQGQATNESSIARMRVMDSPIARYAKRQVNNVSMMNLTTFLSLDSLLTAWPRLEYGIADPRVVVVHNGLSGVARSKIQNKWHPLHSSLYIWQKVFLPGVLLTALGDRVEMAYSIEGRQPFLDHELAEYVNQLPPSMKLKYDPNTWSFNEKWILKEAAKPFITEELYNRRKHPFSAPVTYRIGGPLYRYLSGLMTQENVEELGFLDWDKCRTLVDDGFGQHDIARLRKLFVVTQFIEIGKRFGVARAKPEYAIATEPVASREDLREAFFNDAKPLDRDGIDTLEELPKMQSKL